jgi:cholesterol transport system auxiliary component
MNLPKTLLRSTRSARRSAGRAAAIASLALVSACALLSKSEPNVPRYFSPETSSAPPAGTASAQASGLELRLGVVKADGYIQDKIVHRDSAYEVGYYEERLWTDKPDAYVRRALARALFDVRGVREVVSGVGTTLDVDVVAFEEVMKPQHVGRIALTYVLYDDRVVRLSRSIAVERPIPDAKGDAAAEVAVQAMAEALSAAVDGIADATVTELRAEAAPSKPAP